LSRIGPIARQNRMRLITAGMFTFSVGKRPFNLYDAIPLTDSRKKLISSLPAGVEWFYLFGGLYLISKYFWILDDAFIYFRYVDNFLFLDLGLVFNQGEYVEGFSSPLWIILLALIRATGASYTFAVKGIAVICFVLFWYMLVRLNKQISPDKSPIINLPLACLSLNYGVLCYFSSGVETPLIQLSAAAYALYIINPSSRILQILLAVSPLIRPELAVPFVIAAAWTWIHHKKNPLKMVLLAMLVVGSWMMFRIYYYADLFPNTFYLKDTIYIKQGLLYLQDTLKTYHFYFLILAMTPMVAFLSFKRVELQCSNRLIMLVIACLVTAYVVKIGGDARHFRYMAFPFCLSVCAFAGIVEAFYHILCKNKIRFILPLTGILVSMVVFYAHPPQISRVPVEFDLGWTFPPVRLEKIRVRYRIMNNIVDATYNRQKIDLEALSIKNDAVLKFYGEVKKPFKYRDVNRETWCEKIYKKYMTRRIIHGFGLTDAILGRTRVFSGMAGHKYSLFPLADDLVSIHRSRERIGRGMYREIVEEKKAPEWITRNLDSIEIIEKKIYNDHDLMENMKLAFRFPDKILP